MKNKLSINTRNQISVIEPMFSKNLLLKEKILKHFKKVNFNYKKLNENQLINKINDAEGIILGLQPLTKKVIDKSKNLKIVAKFGVGIDNIDLNECKKKKILVRRAVGANAISVAEVVISNSINLIRNINQNYNKLKKGLWEKSIGHELYKKKFGIIGLGKVGKEVAKRLVPFKCKIYCNDIKTYKKFCKDKNIKIVTLEKILKTCHIISFHTPLTKLTKNLLNAKNINLLMNNSIVINTSRGPVIDLKNIMKTVKKKNIQLYLDVFPEEPFKDKKFLNRKNDIYTPHICGTSEESKMRIGLKNIKALKQFFAR